MATKTKKDEALEEKKVDQPIKSSDDGMPEPETKDYGTAQNSAPNPGKPQEDLNKVYIKILPKLRTDLENSVGTLGYNREIGSPEMHVQVWQIFEVLDKTKDKYLTEDQVNQFISMFARAPWNIINGLMKNLQDKQNEYFEVVTKEQLVQQTMANSTL